MKKAVGWVIGFIFLFLVAVSIQICCLPEIGIAKYGQRRVQTFCFPNTTIVKQESKVLRYFPNALVEVKTFYIEDKEKEQENPDIHMRVGHHHNPSFLTSLKIIYAMTFKGRATRGMDY